MAREPVALPATLPNLDWDPARGMFVQATPEVSQRRAAWAAVEAGHVRFLAPQRRSLSQRVDSLVRLARQAGGRRS